MINKIFPIIVFIFSFNFFKSQFKETDFKKIPENYSSIKIVHEKNEGILLSYKNFRDGLIIKASDIEKKKKMTTMLMGSASLLYNNLKENYPNEYKLNVIKPNSFLSTEFQIEISYPKGKIFILRKMIYSKIRVFSDLSDDFKNINASNDPSNYGVIFGFEIKDDAEKQKIINIIEKYCVDNNILIENSI